MASSWTRTKIKARLLPIMYSEHGDVYAAVRTMLAEAWEEGYGAGQHTDVAAETQAPNPYGTRVEPWQCPGNDLGPHDWEKTGDGPQSVEYFKCRGCDQRMVD